MSLDGTTNTFIPYTINGINPVAGSINTTNFVKYSGNTSNTDLGGFDLTTAGTISAQNFAIPDNNTNDESWITYTVSTMGNPSTLGGLITTNLTSGSTMYFTGSVLGSPNFQFTTLGNAGKVVCTNGNSVMSTTINAGQLDYITALTSQAGGVGQNNTWTGTNDFTTLTSVGALRITSSIANNDYSLSVNSFDQLEIKNITTGNTMTTSGDALAILNINAGGTITTGNIEVAGNSQLIGSGTVVWTQTALSDDYEIKDDVGDTRLKLTKTTGLTISTLNITAVPSSTPSLALGIDTLGGVVSYAVPSPPVNLLPLNNIWTGTNTFNNTVSTLSTTTVSSKAYLTQSLRTAGMSSQAVNPGVITGGAPWLLTPSPASSPLAACYSPTQIWITGARYLFRFANFSSPIFGVSLTFFQANVADTGAVAISATFPVETGDFTGIFTPNINSSFLGQVYLQWQGTANKTFTWTSFTYEVGTLEVVGELEMNGIANIHAGSPHAVPNNYMSPGSLTIGDITKNYGGGVAGWTTNTAGLLFECLDNTEIAVHDSGLRVASLMYYDGPANTIRLGRDMGWATSDVATASKLTVQDVIRFGNYSGGNYDNIQFMRGTGTGQYPNIRCQDNYIAMYVSDAGGWVSDSQVGDLVIRVNAGENIRFSTGSSSGLVVDSSNDVIATNNLKGGCLVVNGGGTYQAGCIYSDANWGMLFRARVVPAQGIFAWYDSAGAERMRLLTNATLQLTTGTSSPGFVHTDGTIIVETWIGGGGGWYGTRTNHPLRFYTNNSSTRMSVNTDGTVNVATRLAIGGVNSSGVLDIVNPNGIYTHFGWTDNQNYIRGVATLMDCPLTLNSSGSGSGLPRIQSPNNNRSMRYDDPNLLTYLINNAGSSPIPFTHSSWGAGSGGGYTVIARNQGINEMGLGFGVSSAGAYRSVIISLAPAIIWGELILSGGTIYTSCNGTINLYTAGGGWIFVSDQRCKRDIKDIKTTRSLQRIMALKPKTYKKIYPENSETPISDKVRNADHIGFLAQDVMESNPHCIDEWVDDKSVCDGDDGTRLGIAYGDINVHMVGAIQELKKQNDAQQKEIDELKDMVKALMEKLK
jgi:hypothetical protein